MKRYLVSAIVALTQLPSSAIELESKDGRRMDVTILNADDSKVTVQKTGERGQTVIPRESLSMESNEIVNDFVQRDVGNKLQEGGATKFEYDSADGSGKEVLWLKLPRKDIEHKTKSIRSISFVTGDSSSCSMGLEQGDSASAEKYVTKRKTAFQQLTKSGATAKELEKFHKQNKIERRRFGIWEGFFYRYSYSGTTFIHGAFLNGSLMLRVNYQISDDDPGAFTAANYESTVKSVIYQKLKLPKGEGD